jgi:predicted dehydrogenase
MACLQAGLNVLVEKPMAISVADCKRMMELAKQTDKTIFTVVQNRFNPPVAALKTAIAEGRLGRIQNIQINCFWNRPAAYYKDSWHGTVDLDGGILFTQFSHFIDLLYWLFGPVKTVQTLAQNFQHQDMIAGEDAGAVLLQMDSGAIASLHYSVNSYAKNAEGSLTVLAEKGTVKIGGEYLNTIAYQSLESGPLLMSDATNAPNQYGTYQGSMSNHGMVYANLVAALQGSAPYYATSEEALQTVAIIERIHQSINLQS